ncbi:hypothetical protein M3Y94_00102200 [Aphelenchoides besseyi]|nr:hypothetical protein M3Y94_00102200 [Aphelenchoides besseyi]KAI6237580.1 hypothetical protein M3Y95_00280400 [Aphelenchoides besseyi]
MKVSVLSVTIVLVLSIELNAQRRFASRDAINDEEHIAQHLKDKVKVQQLNEQQKKFHYFKLHDLNRDSSLDGLEIMKAITHNHDDESNAKPRDVMSDEDLETLVDSVLKEMDLDNDGKIQFAEYVKKAF